MEPRRAGDRYPWLFSSAVLVVFALIAAIHTWPLLGHLATILPSDPDDPSLNASILHWNATHVPFSISWWNAPQYYPTPDVAAFTENLVGITPFSAPVDWLTGSAIAAYNIAFFLTWPLSAWATYLLVRYLTKRQDAAIAAGLAYAFMPYRIVETSHIQMLATEWLPLLLLGLHGYLSERRRRWLGLFAVAWILNALSNGYFMLFGAVLVGLWVAYFGSVRRAWPAARSVVLTWAVATVPLIPILLKYQAVHEQFGLFRFENEIEAYGAQLTSWTRVSSEIWFWRHFLPDGKDDLFPGATAPLLVLVGVGLLLWRRRQIGARGSLIRWTRPLLGGAMAIATTLGIVALARGPFDLTIGSYTLFRVSDLNLELNVALLCGIGIVAMTPSTREAVARRSPLVFYTASIFLCALFAFGPKLQVGDTVLLSRAPYWWLMRLPGFDQIRVPPRFWMLGTLCLAVAAGLALAHVTPSRKSMRRLVFGLVAACTLLEGWAPAMRMAAPPDIWPVEATGATGHQDPLIELPIGPGFDYPATFRGPAHGRRVVNGVSGYNPPYYLALVAGLQARDSSTLAALSAFGPLDAVITRSGDPDGAIQRYVETLAESTPIASDESHVMLHIPRGPQEPLLGPAMTITSIRASSSEESAALMHDGSVTTGWDDRSSRPSDAWVIADLGSVQDIGGVTHAIGDFSGAFPRRLLIELSTNGTDWTTAWDGRPTAAFVMASVRAPRIADMRFPFPVRPARFVRLRQVDPPETFWRISELQIHGAAPGSR